MKVTALKASALLALALVLSAVAIAQAHAQAPAWAPADEVQRAQQIVRAAECALFKVKSFVNSIMQNESVKSRLEGLGLMDDLQGNASLLEQAEALVTEAKESLAAGKYTGAMVCAVEAMRICKDVCRNVHKILELAGLEIETSERPEVQAQGILVAVNRSLERIERLKALVEGLKLPQVEEIKEKLSKAEGLLDIDEIKGLLSSGNVSEAAHGLAEANKLIGQAYGLLHSTAKERIVERMERYRAKIRERFEGIVNNMSEEELGQAIRRLGFPDVGKLKKFIDDLIEQARGIAKVKIGEALQKLGEARDKLKELAKIYIAKRLPPIAEEPSLDVDVEVFKERVGVVVRVTVKNVGRTTILFPNTAFGSVVEKEVDGRWIPYYSPISAQVIVKLEPGEERSFSIRLFRPEPGHYRVAVHGFVEKAMTPVFAWAEFTIK
jgi:HEPN domain-containing protein